MTDLEPIPPGGADDLFDRVSSLVEEVRAGVAMQANLALTLMNQQIGNVIHTEVLGGTRGPQAEEVVASLGRQLSKRYEPGSNRSSLYRMVQFSQVFPDSEVVASLGRQLSWTHFKVLLPVYSDEARAFYIQQTLDALLSVRALRKLIGRQGFERLEIANAETPGGRVASRARCCKCTRKASSWRSTGRPSRPRKNSSSALQRSTVQRRSASHAERSVSAEGHEDDK